MESSVIRIQCHLDAQSLTVCSPEKSWLSYSCLILRSPGRWEVGAIFLIRNKSAEHLPGPLLRGYESSMGTSVAGNPVQEPWIRITWKRFHGSGPMKHSLCGACRVSHGWPYLCYSLSWTGSVGVLFPHPGTLFSQISLGSGGRYYVLSASVLPGSECLPDPD